MFFEELVKRISPKLKGIAYRLNGHFSFFNEEDLYQEAMVALWQDFQDGTLNDKTDSYILQGCYFHLKNYIRKTSDKMNLLSLDSVINTEDTTLEERLSLENPERSFDELNCKMLVERLQNNGLTQREKEVFSFCLEGLTTREIGERLGISHVRVVKIKASIRRKSNYLLDKY